MRNLFVRLACLLTFLATALHAQTGNQGSITGTVTDSSGAVVNNVGVTAANKATSSTFSATTNDQGIYNFPVLSVGDYELRFNSGGFGELTRAVRVNVGAKINLDVKLTAQGKTENVTVTAEAPVVETTRTQVSNTVGQEAIDKIPVNGRNFIDYVLLSPGVTRDQRTGDISFAGQRGTLNSMTVDGADNNNTFFGQTSGRTGSGRAPYQFSEESVQEFQVNSNGYTAEQGRAGGAVINVITKSGTNSFHGSGFEYYRDRGLNADDPINKKTAGVQGTAIPRKPAYHFHQFGGSVGGPIVRDRAFFFFNYDGQRNKQPNTVIFTPPALSAIPARAAIQQTGLNYLNARTASWNRGLNEDTYLGKADWSISQKNQLSVRYNRQNFTGLGFENGGLQNSAEHTGSSIVDTDTIASQLTSSLSNSFVNVARFQYQRDHEPGTASSINPEATIRNGSATLLIVGRNNFSPRETTLDRYQWADTVTYVRGRHTFKAGADFIRDKILNFFPGNFSGAYTFADLLSFGCSLQGIPLDGSNPNCPNNPANNLLQAFPGTGTTGATTHPNIWDIAGFVQDDWRLSTRLTVNLGIRYDVELPEQPSVQNPNALALGFDTARIHEDLNNIAPRLGFAWDPWGQGKVVFRGGYGIFYGRTPSILTGTAHSNNGINVQTKQFFGAAIPQYPNSICGAPVAVAGCAPPTGGTSRPTALFLFSRDYQQPMVQQANLGFEWELARNTSLAVNGLFVKGGDLQRTRDVNLPATTTATVTVPGGQPLSYLTYRNAAGTLARPFTAFDRISLFESGAESQYSGVTLQLNRRMTNNLQFSAAYTWGHAIDDAPDATAVVIPSDDNKIVNYTTLPQLDRANSVNDQRHRFVLSQVWDLDYYHGDSLLKHLLAGWQVASVFTAQSGQPYSALVNGDLNGDTNSARNDRVPGTGRNQFHLPANKSWDPRLTKSVKLGEVGTLQFFGEAFNVLNHFNVYSVRTNQYGLTLVGGRPTALTAPAGAQNAFGFPVANGAVQNNGARVLQLGAKFTF